MLILECAFCKAILHGAPFCHECGRPSAPLSSAGTLPPYPSSSMAPGARHARDDDDDEDDDDDKPRPKKKPSSSGMGTAAAVGGGAAGLGIGMIIAIVGGVGACCLCIIALPIGFALMVPALQKTVGAADRTQKINSAKQIAIACHTYTDINKHLPSPRMQPVNFGAKATDLSWRVSILPYMEQKALFDKYDRNQDWNGPNNHPHQVQMPKEFGTGTMTKTQYFVGPKTLFPQPLHKMTMNGITDGLANTILFAEAVAPVAWAQQADMEVPPGGAVPATQGQCLVAMCDASVRIVDRKKATDDVLRILINPTDGQVAPANWDQ